MMSRIKINFWSLFLFCLPFLYCLLLLARPDQSFTQDLGRHIKTGQIIWQTHSVPAVNLFSYTEPSHIFINHHWLSEVILYLSYTYLGIYSLLFLKVVLIIVSFGIIYLLAFKKNPLFAFLASFFYLYIFSYRFYVRPELFSFLFMALFIFLISKYQEKGNLLFLLPLPFTEIFWVNIHIYFILGPVIFICLLVSELIKERKLNAKLLIIFLTLCLTLLINPSGIAGALEPFTILNQYGYSIVENQSVFFLNQFFFNPQIFMFEIIAAALFVLSFFCLKRANIFWLSISFMATFLSFQMVRNFPIFVLFTLPLFVIGMEGLIKKIKDRQIQSITWFSMIFAAAGFAIITSWVSLTSPAFGFSFVPGAEKAVNYFENHHLKGPIFNNFDIGSYLIFRLYPQEKVFVDGRPEAYSVKFFDDYKRMQEDPKFFEQEVRKYNIQTIFFAYTDITPWAQDFLQSISKDKRWKQLYLDNSIVILVKR